MWDYHILYQFKKCELCYVWPSCHVLYQVRVTNLMGGDLGQLTVTADSARHLGDEAIVLSKKQFTAAAGDK